MDMFDHKGTLDRLNRMPKDDLLKLAETLEIRAYVSKDKRFMDFFWVTGSEGTPKKYRKYKTDVVHGISTYFRDGRGDSNYWMYETFSHFPLVTRGQCATHDKIPLEKVSKPALARAILDALEVQYNIREYWRKLDILECFKYMAGLRKDWPKVPRD